MRSMVSCANGGRPVLASGEATAINGTSSRQGTTSCWRRWILTSRSVFGRRGQHHQLHLVQERRFALRLMPRFSPISARFFMTQVFRFVGLHAIGNCTGF